MERAVTDDSTTEARTPSNGGAGSSREVNLFAVHQFLAPHLGDPDYIVGTPSWTQLPDDDSAKWRAILWACMWWAIGENLRQEAIADAGEQISEAEDWRATARQVQRRREIDALREAS